MNNLLSYLAETAAGLALFYGLYWLVLKNDTHFQLNRIYLLASLLAAHLLPWFRITSPFRRIEAAPVPLEDLARAVPAAPAAAGMSWEQTALLLYTGGCLFFIIRLAWHLWHLRLILRRQPELRRAGVRLVYVDEDCPPFSFFRTAFIHRPAPGEEPELNQILAHEKIHIRQGHSLDILLVQLAVLGQWFNPFIWLYIRSLKEIHEYLADREVLAQGFNPSRYKQILFEQNLGARPFEFANHFRQSQIRRRLAMMTRLKSGHWSYCKYLLVLPAAALLVLLMAQPQITAAPASPGGDALMPAASQDGTSQSDEVRQKEQQYAKQTAKEEEQKKLQAEFEKKFAALHKEYEATTDPQRKKELELKLKELKFKAQQMLEEEQDLSDPDTLQKIIDKGTREVAKIEEEYRQARDPEQKEKLQQKMQDHKKKLEFLKAKLADLQQIK